MSVRIKHYKYKTKNLAQPLLNTSDTSNLFEEEDNFDFIDDLIMSQNDDDDEPLSHSSSFDDNKDDDDSMDMNNLDFLDDIEEETEMFDPTTTTTTPLKDDSKNNSKGPHYRRRTTAKLKINELIEISTKYENILTINNDDLVTKEDKIDAIILQLKLPHIYNLNEDEQYSLLQNKYPWIDDPDGEIDTFQLEEIQEIVANMTAIERRYMHDTIEKYKDRDKEKYRLQPAELKTMNKYIKMSGKDKKNKKKKTDSSSKNKKTYVCSGCGVILYYKKAKKLAKYSKSWRGYVCPTTGREFIFHSRLCVKFRKAKEWIRDAVHEQNKAEKAKMQIDFLSDEGLNDQFQPTSIYTTFDEHYAKTIPFKSNIREYRMECISTDLRGYDIDSGDRFLHVPIAIKYLDQREFSIAMFKFLIREVSIKKFNLFWEFLQFFSSYINTPTLMELLFESSDIIFSLDTSHNNHDLIDFLTTVCEGALYPIATCLYIAAYLRDSGENYWDEDTTESLSKHFRNMAFTIIEEIESTHLVAIILETPTNIYDLMDGDSADDNVSGGLSVIDIAIKYKMLKFLENTKIVNIATTLWYERKIVHPLKQIGEEISFFELFKRLYKTPAKFYFSPSGLNIINVGLYLMYLISFSYVTILKRYNYEDHLKFSEYILWWFVIGTILNVSYNVITSPRTYFLQLNNQVEATKAIVWIMLLILKFVYTAEEIECTASVVSDNPLLVYCGGYVTDPSTGEEIEIDPDCHRILYREDPYICTDSATHNSKLVELYMCLWSIQCILFWSSLVFYFRRLRTVGPLLKMILSMVWDLFNFLLILVIFWIACALSMYYIVSDDINNFTYESSFIPHNETISTVDYDANGVVDYLNYTNITTKIWSNETVTLESIPSTLLFTMQSILQSQNWEAVSLTSPAIGVPRALMLDAIITATTAVGGILLLNLLIAMLATTYQEVSETTRLEVNYTRILQSYNASRVPSLIPSPLNYFAYALMAIWFIIDLLITTFTARTKMLNDWYFTPLNRSVFSAGDFIDYRDIEDVEDDDDNKQLLKHDNNNKKGKYIINSGYVQHQFTSEIAQIRVAAKEKLIHKNDIKKIRKSLLTERLSDADSNGFCASITTSGRYYCKYCRYFFHGDQIGNVYQIYNLFEYYGILLDEDDIGKLSNMVGDKIKLKKRKKNNKNKKKEEKSDDDNNNNNNDKLRKHGVAQLCPECYRAFYCSLDHCDEVQRLQYLAEVCSFWVFMGILWLPLIILFSIPGLLSYLYQILIGRESISKEKTRQNQQKKFDKKLKMSENIDKHRKLVNKKFDDNVPLNDRINYITDKLLNLKKKIRESVADDEEDNIVTQLQDKLLLKKLELTPEESKKRMIQLKNMKNEWMKKLNQIIKIIKKGKNNNNNENNNYNKQQRQYR